MNFADIVGLQAGEAANAAGGATTGFGAALVYAVTYENRPNAMGEAILGRANPTAAFGWERSFHIDAPHGRVSSYHLNADVGPLSSAWNHTPVPEWLYRATSTTTLRNVGRASVALGLALDAADILTACDTGRAVGGAAGGWAGAIVGAEIGSMVIPGLGTVVGGLVGGFVGSITGQYFGASIF